MRDKELLKEIIEIILSGESSDHEHVINSNDTLKLAKLLNSNISNKELDTAIWNLIFKYPDVFSLYGITMHNNGYIKYNGYIVYYDF